MVQLSHLYMATGKTIALTIWTFVGKVVSLLFNMLSRFVIAFLPSSQRLLISFLQSPSAVILELIPISCSQPHRCPGSASWCQFPEDFCLPSYLSHFCWVTLPASPKKNYSLVPFGCFFPRVISAYIGPLISLPSPNLENILLLLYFQAVCL